MKCSSVLSRRLKVLAVSAVALASWSMAHAFNDALGTLAPLDSTFEVGAGFPAPTFLDTLTFGLSSSTIGSFTAKGQGVVIPGFLTLLPATGVTFAIYKGATDLTGFGTSFKGLTLVAGADYSFKVKGGSGGYKVTWSLSPVPEPESMALALAGLGIVGGVMRRRLR